jgi:hypothetical protein
MIGHDPRRTREVLVLFPPDPARRPTPDPIPASYYARPPRASQVRAETPRRSGGRRRVSYFRNWPIRTQLLAAIACLVSVIWILQTLWRPTLGLLGFVTLGTVILATDAWGVRSRLPLLRSENRRVAAGGWGVIGSLVLVTTILAAVAPSSPSSSRQHPRPSSPFQTATSSLMPVTPSPPPSPLPVAAPRTTPEPSSPAVSLLNAPLSVQRSQTVTLRVETAPNTDCSIDVVYPSGPELDSATSDDTGNLSWTWRVGKHVQPGSWPITVSCGTGTASTQITVS